MDDLEQLANIYKALSDPTRLKIVRLLSKNKNLCVNAITKRLDVSQSAVSQHLRILREAALVEQDRRGFHIHYSLNHESLKTYKEKIINILGEEFH